MEKFNENEGNNELMNYFKDNYKKKDDNDYEEHYQICKRLNELYCKKNKDYGNSFYNTADEFGITSPVIRLSDKVNRIKSLLKNKQQLVQDESLHDSVEDLANYAIMTLIWLERQGK